MKKKFVQLTLILLLITFSFGCASQTAPNILVEQPVKKNTNIATLKLQLKNNISSLDPAFVNSKEERLLVGLIYSGLVRLDNSSMRPAPALAKSWDISPDYMKYIFRLSPNIKFQNGNVIKASDVKFSWERMVYVNSPEKYIFSNVAGYWEYITGRSNGITGIKALDDKTLEVDLIAPDQAFLSSLTQPAASVVDRYQVVNKSERFGKPGNYSNPVLIPNGNGPYKVYDWLDKNLIVLGNSNNYNLKKPAIKRIEITLEDSKEDNIADYTLGNLDAIVDVSQADTLNSQNIKGSLQNVALKEFSFLRINPQVPNSYLHDQRIRKALMLSIDFKRIGMYLNSDLVRYLPGNITEYLYTGNHVENESTIQKTYDAAKLLTESGHAGGKGIEFTLYYLDDPNLKTAALLLKGQWSARGIRVYPVGVSREQLDKLKANRVAQIYLDKWLAPFPAVEAFFYPEFHSAFGRGISSEIDSLIADALFTQDENQKHQKFKQIEKSLETQYFLRPLITNSMTLLVKPKVQGLKLDGLGNMSLEEVKIKNQ